FASPRLMTVLEAEGYWYAIRLKANAILERQVVHLLKRPVGRPSKKPKGFYHSFRYQAKSWNRARRGVAKIEWHAGELFPRVGFVVTNLRRSAKRVVKFYNGRGKRSRFPGRRESSAAGRGAVASRRLTLTAAFASSGAHRAVAPSVATHRGGEPGC